MKTVLGVIALFLIVLIVVSFSKNLLGKDFFAIGSKKSVVMIGNNQLNVLVARDEKAKEIGLSGRTSLSEDTVMVFPFDTAGYYAFWMKDMKFPIDMIFMRNKKVVTMYKNVPVPSVPTATLPIYTPQQPADMVLETHAGEIDKLGIKPGNLLNISL